MHIHKKAWLMKTMVILFKVNSKDIKTTLPALKACIMTSQLRLKISIIVHGNLDTKTKILSKSDSVISRFILVSVL